MEEALSRQSVTGLLQRWGAGDKEALDQLMPLVYDQLHKLALRYMRSERREHTLSATALVHEAYLRLVDADVTFQNQAQFFALAARILRNILVNYAKAHKRQKRGGAAHKVEFEENMVVGPDSAGRVLELDEALQRLALHDQRKSDIMELLCFGGLTYDETAAALQISPATVHREIKLAKTWLRRELTRSG
jgi:RNA polymerase sigma factor (TIGR02999 family)